MEKGTFELIKAISKDDNRLIQIQSIAGNTVSGNQHYFVIEEHLFRQMVGEIEAQQKEIIELDESLHIARVGRRDLIAYTKQLKEQMKRLYEVANKFDLAYLHSIQNNGESSFTGEEYEDLSDVMIEVEHLLGID